tara:strand:- start:147 stop:578 length:432 start_codon:yes stop_codon:yes gene_type:complete
MVKRTTNKGVVIDLESLMAQNSDSPAMGNMRVNAKGDVIGKGGEIVQKSEDRVRAYYEDNPMSSTAKSSLKGPMPDQPVQEESDMAPEMKTAEAQQTEQDQSVQNAVEEPVQEQKVAGYKEVEMPNGDIEMVPVYEDDWTDET